MACPQLGQVAAASWFAASKTGTGNHAKHAKSCQDRPPWVRHGKHAGCQARRTSVRGRKQTGRLNSSYVRLPGWTKDAAWRHWRASSVLGLNGPDEQRRRYQVGCAETCVAWAAEAQPTIGTDAGEASAAGGTGATARGAGTNDRPAASGSGSFRAALRHVEARRRTNVRPGGRRHAATHAMSQQQGAPGGSSDTAGWLVWAGLVITGTGRHRVRGKNSGAAPRVAASVDHPSARGLPPHHGAVAPAEGGW